MLAFRHVPFEGLGLIHPLLESRGIAVEYVDLYQPGAVYPGAERADGLIFLGGPMSVNDPLPYLQWEMRAIRQAVEQDRPVLGICLGAQLMAKALGGVVYRNPAKEIGWFDIAFTGAARHDRLFAQVPDPSTVFHWHGETFDLPDGAVLLASSERCRNQAFRVGDVSYGLQFHLEVTPEMIEDWCGQDGNSQDVRELDAPLDTRCHTRTLKELAEAVFGRWCDLLAERTASHSVMDSTVAGYKL
ncbi:MAG TPA: gamma-glutamyl-gamma-aminobutyrate hydrolase family protein [Candidatus Sulfopaludibacter sp.]|nr:gamma-glutamyl-gamma-aminobutyrate hydrolase family protein [Candidatus Sulfopaludibacter sp.]